jgi:hypothetical protein
MAFELEALVGHMYVAGGRTIKTTPPGALCEVAPKTAARGREIDTLFILVLPSGNVAPNTFYEQMSLMAAERYFSNTGSVTSALRDVFNTLNHNLFNHNSSGRKHYEANMIVAVMRGVDLYVARAGAAIMVLRHGAETKTVPESLSDDDKLFKAPLGVQPIPDMEMSRFTLKSGTRMLLSDVSIAEITEANLSKAMLTENIERVLDELKLLITLQIQLMAVEFVPPEQPVMIPAATGQSSAVLAAQIAAARAKNGTGLPETEADAEKAPSAPRSKQQTPQSRLKGRAKEGAVSVARSAGHGMTAIGNLGDKLVGGEANSQQKRRNMALITGAMIGIPVLIVAVVMLSWVLNIGQTQYEECVNRASSTADIARTAPQDSSPISIITAWDTTLQIIRECQELRPDFTDPILQTVQLEAQLAIDAPRGITRLQANPLWVSLDEDANIRELILNGLNLYALDNVNSVVYRVQLNDSGRNLAAMPQPLQFMSHGARLDGNTLGRIIGITYDDLRDLIIALDENGVMVTCRPLFINQCEAQQLQGFENVRNPIRVAMWQGFFYVLDTWNAQIWRFTPIGNTDSFSNPPTEYYQGAVRPANLERSVDFVIGSTGTVIGGDVYVLFEDGTMSRHRGGEALGFAFQGFPDGLERPDQTSTQALHLNDSPIDTGFYMISRPYKTIYYTTTAGTFQTAFQLADESLFERLNDVAVDPEQNIIYAASGNAILLLETNR